MRDTQFLAANHVLVGQCRLLKGSGQDVSKHYPPISEADLGQMYLTKVLGVHTPRALQYKTFFELVLHFGRRGQEGLRLLEKGHILFEKPSRVEPQRRRTPTTDVCDRGRPMSGQKP